jgi:hypothetical protein
MLEAEWTKIEGDGLQLVPCILGAFYGTSKTIYQQVGGFIGHKQCGTLEPLISLRYRLLGGECLIDMDLTTGHIFLTEGSPKSTQALIYNKLMLADTLLPEELRDEVFSWAKGINFGLPTLHLYKSDAQATEAKQFYEGKLPETDLLWAGLRQSFKDL